MLYSKYKGNTKETKGKTGARSAPEDFWGDLIKYKGNAKETKGKPAREARRKSLVYFIQNTKEI